MVCDAHLGGRCDKCSASFQVALSSSEPQRHTGHVGAESSTQYARQNCSVSILFRPVGDPISVAAYLPMPANTLSDGCHTLHAYGPRGRWAGIRIEHSCRYISKMKWQSTQEQVRERTMHEGQDALAEAHNGSAAVCASPREAACLPNATAECVCVLHITRSRRSLPAGRTRAWSAAVSTPGAALVECAKWSLVCIRQR